MKKNKFITLLLSAMLVVQVLTGCGSPGKTENSSAAAGAESATTPAAVVTDFAGNTFSADQPVNTVMAIHPIFTMLALRLAPEKVISVDKIFTQQYLDENGKIALLTNLGLDRIKTLPMTNTFMQGIDAEQVLNLNPDIIVTLDKDTKAKELQAETKKPLLIVSKNTLENYSKSFRILGIVLGNSVEAGQLADYWDGILSSISAKTDPIAAEDRPNVYHCASGSIYATVGKDTIMASVVRLAGGNNLGDEISDGTNSLNESIEVSMEQILNWNPDVVVANTSAQYDEIMGSPDWKAVNAVKNGKVYCQLKYGQIDGLTSLPGLIWYHTILTDPDDQSAMDAYYKEAQRFFKLFFKYDISVDELKMKR